MLPNTRSVQGSTDDEVEVLVADGDKSPEEMQAIGFAKEEICKHFLAWFILSCALKDKTYDDK